MDFYIKLMAAYVALLQVADGVSTFKAMKAGLSESNPIIRSIMAEIGVLNALVVSKTAVMLVMLFMATELLLSADEQSKLTMVAVLAALSVLYTVIVANNFRLLANHAKGQIK